MEILFKYRNYDEYVGDNIRNSRFKMSFPGDTNDLFEGMTHSIDEDGQKGVFFQTMNNPMACFSKVFDDMAMWAYYAGNHTGVCFEVEISKIFMGKRYEVQYQDEPLMTKISTLENSRFPGQVDAVIPNEILFTKKTQWSNEKEVRYIDTDYFHDIDNPITKFFYVKKIRSVIMGYKIPDSNKKEILKLCKENGITTYRIVPNYIGYKLERVMIKDN